MGFWLYFLGLEVFGVEIFDDNIVRKAMISETINIQVSDHNIRP